MKEYTFIDLFCGIGGFHQALVRNKNFKCVMACDIDEKCREVYEENYGIKPESDIKKVNEKNLPDFDILCAGFPCFLAGTNVLTYSGYKKIENVEKNDKLLTHKYKFQNIMNLQKKIYSGTIYSFHINHHPKVVECTDEHPFYVREKKKIWDENLKKYKYMFMSPVWKKAYEITKDDYVGMIISNKNNVVDVPIEIYKSFEDIPEYIQDTPKEYINEFIYGYFDSNNNEITTKSLHTAYGLQRLYLKLGYICSIKTFTNAKNILYKLKIENEDLQISFIDDNYVWYSLSKITKKYTTDTYVYNFEVENDNSYIVENIIVHNCQSFSNGGKKGNLQDSRGQLFEDILRIANEKKPKLMFLENVKHIKKIDDGKTFAHIIKRINETGYYVKDDETIFELSPHQLGIPQQRERVIFVCIQNELYDKNKIIKLNLPNTPIDMYKIIETDKTITDKYKVSYEVENILNIWEEMIKVFDEGETLSPTIMCNEFYKTYNEEDFAKLPKWKQDYIIKNKPIYNKYKKEWNLWFERNKDVLQKKEIYGKLEWQCGRKKQNDSIWNYFIQFRQSGIRVKRANYFPTLVAIVQTPIYAKEKRYITPRECARLQSFPDNFKMHKSDNTWQCCKC